MSPIKIPTELKSQIERAAARRGQSVEEFVRQACERLLDTDPARDLLFADDAVFDGDAPADTVARHDDYLYGEAS